MSPAPGFKDLGKRKSFGKNSIPLQEQSNFILCGMQGYHSESDMLF